MNQERVVTTTSPEETIALGRDFGAALPVNSVVLFFGDLGAGKTTFIKGVVEGYTGSANDVMSPTYVYLNIYGREKPVYHFDLYRLERESDFLAMGFDDHFEDGGIALVEWSERIANLVPHGARRVEIEPLDEAKRRIRFS